MERGGSSMQDITFYCGKKFAALVNQSKSPFLVSAIVRKSTWHFFLRSARELQGR